MNDITIRKLTIDDLHALHNISIRTFRETFSADNTEENLNKYLQDSFSQEKLSDEIGNPNSEFYFALLHDQPVGYLKINSGGAQTEPMKSALEIERIYVLKEFHRRKVGQLLYEKAVDIARESGVDFVWLGVWEENKRAIAFYKKNGFIEFDSHVFMLGDDAQTDVLMKLSLHS